MDTDSVVTASLVVPSIVRLIVHLRDSEEKVLHCGKLIQQLQESIETRFSGIVRPLNQSDVSGNDHFGEILYFIACSNGIAFKTKYNSNDH